MIKKILFVFTAIVGALISVTAFPGVPNIFKLERDIFDLEKDKKAPVDWGYGPGKGIGAPRPNFRLGHSPPKPRDRNAPQNIPPGSYILNCTDSLRACPPELPTLLTSGTKSAAIRSGAIIPTGPGHGLGFFGPPVPWPIIPLHMALLPDGRVMTYGTDQSGNQGAQLVYDVWTPTIGTGTNAHQTLPNTTSTDIFCSAATLLGSGGLLIAGGDLTISGTRNFSNNKVELFTPQNNTISAMGQMNFPRWYDTIMTLPNGNKLVLGGESKPGVGVPMPEVFNAASGVWTTLTNVSVKDDGHSEWYYPRAFVGFDGAVYFLPYIQGQIVRITTDGVGTKTVTAASINGGATSVPTVMLTPFKVLSVRFGTVAQLVDLSSNPPVVTDLANFPNANNFWANLTVTANGDGLLTGGSGVANQLTNVVYQAEIFSYQGGDPRTGHWRPDSSAAIPRLYHSATLLLPDGSVLTGGGGSPGPVNELNVEIYYPPYLYANDGSGNPAPRPTVNSVPSSLNLGQNFSFSVGSNDTVGYINLIRMGTNTHSFNPEQRGVGLGFTQSGTTVTANLGYTSQYVPPGYYMLFVFNTADTPAVAPIVSIQ